MQCSARLLAITATLALTATGAHAAVTISSGATANMSCSNGVCAPTAPNAVLNSGDLKTLLASGNVLVTTTGSGVQANDIDATTQFGWSGNTLTLDAYHSIAIGAAVNIKHGGALTLLTNDGGTGGTLSFGPKGNVSFANLSSTLSVNRTNYVLVGDIKTLATDIAANPRGAFALANPYDASVHGTYSACPIPTEFTGQFEELGNAISNLSVSGPTSIGQGLYEGLFAVIDPSATVSGLHLENVSISTIERYVFEGSIAGETHGVISFSAASGILTIPKKSSGGGLAGLNDGTIANSHSTINLDGNTRSEPTGGLVGINIGTVQGSYSTGNVSSSWSGGLVGENEGQVEYSFATGSVTGSVAGGLVGISESGTIEFSYATGKVRAVRWQYPPEMAGGLVGLNSGAIDNSYSTGAVLGLERNATNVGGLVGLNISTISFSYSTGTVSAGTGGLIGGLIGDDESISGSLSDTYWDTDTSGITNLSQGAGNIANDPGITGLTTAQLQSGLPQGFDPAVWAENPNINGGLPYLLDNPPPK